MPRDTSEQLSSWMRPK